MQASRAALTVADVGSAKQRCGYRLAGAGFSIGVYTARWDFFVHLKMQAFSSGEGRTLAVYKEPAVPNDLKVAHRDRPCKE